MTQCNKEDTISAVLGFGLYLHGLANSETFGNFS